MFVNIALQANQYVLLLVLEPPSTGTDNNVHLAAVYNNINP